MQKYGFGVCMHEGTPAFAHTQMCFVLDTVQNRAVEMGSNISTNEYITKWDTKRKKE